jgi:DNA-binding response OmpR family regulator
MKPYQILVVEDDPEIGELIVEAFSMELDCDVQLIANGASALNWLKGDGCETNVPTLITLDIHLPGVSGLEILNYVKSQERFKNTRIVMSSSDSILLERARGKADMVVLKPVAYTHFLEIIRWLRKVNEQWTDSRGGVRESR